MNASALLASSLICQSREKRRALFAAVPAQAPATNATEFHTGMHTNRTPGVERALAKNQLLTMPDANTKLICLAGELWLTRDGDIEDYILGAGQHFVVRRGDRAAVQALKPSRMRLVAA